jgi:hypothetical protein
LLGDAKLFKLPAVLDAEAFLFQCLGITAIATASFRRPDDIFVALVVPIFEALHTVNHFTLNSAG